ncbi:hypothetical protein FE391_36585 [Nonomuraea sp. KC401]|uniref:hypothetical protein n=1 Tax=unclassified Nonomuraea TaxID=2593643 RepID=UPI0010FE3900|nr:hypothetical protein [Nonomuraea sp. KC401]NBE92019.1 hypothetical protein [Nonomuraea sp. K271]TLF58254.1 hypothetical protein FE391_36585 [Nonomuraea sp. KC401]
MASGFTGERRVHLEALAELLPAVGLVGRLVGEDDPVLWVWHPHTGRQTIIFATPSGEGWLFLWSPGGQGSADDLARTAAALREALDDARP